MASSLSAIDRTPAFVRSSACTPPLLRVVPARSPGQRGDMVPVYADFVPQGMELSTAAPVSEMRPGVDVAEQSEPAGLFWLVFIR